MIGTILLALIYQKGEKDSLGQAEKDALRWRRLGAPRTLPLADGAGVDPDVETGAPTHRQH